ncbi:MAG: iron ABC transporter substrate-binding protein [Actinomycetota bacterium]
MTRRFPRRPLDRNRLPRLVGLLAVIVIAAACGNDTPAPGGDTPSADASLTVYSGRNEEFIGPLFERFMADTGIELAIRYADSAELAATILEEGENSPADVFVSQDAGSLGAVAAGGLFAGIDPGTLERVDARFRSRDGLWVGISGRARVAAYNTEVVQPEDLPASVTGFTDPEWRGRIGFPPTNGSFQAFVAAMILTEGEDAARTFLEGLAANEPKLYEGNADVVRGIAAGEIDAGLVNHYYKYEIAAEDGDIPVENHFFTDGDPGALVNTAGAGVLDTTEEADAAAELVDYLTGEVGQTYFAEETFEYPVVPGFEPSVELVPLEEIQSPDVDLSDLAGTIEPALELLAEVGLV